MNINKLSWVQRATLVDERAAATNNFEYSATMNKMYRDFRKAVQDKHPSTATQLIVKMGF